jgi:hypothetical protein
VAGSGTAVRLALPFRLTSSTRNDPLAPLAPVAVSRKVVGVAKLNVMLEFTLCQSDETSEPPACGVSELPVSGVE